MFSDFTIFLWLLKLGALVNLYFFLNTFAPAATAADPAILLPARLFFVVSAYRCLFPVQYKNQVVFHNSPLSSIFLTRLLATFSEVAFIYLLAYVIRLCNSGAAWIGGLSWIMVVQVVISQCFVWCAILTRRLIFFFYEELGWAVIVAINAFVSAYLLQIHQSSGAANLLRLNLLFGLVYLPWQFFHLRMLRSDARQSRATDGPEARISWEILREGLWHSIWVRQPTRDAKAWGGLIGLTWMIGYWATLIPLWVNQIVQVFLR